MRVSFMHIMQPSQLMHTCTQQFHNTAFETIIHMSMTYIKDAGIQAHALFCNITFATNGH